MATTLLLELFGGFAGACFAIWLASESLPAPRDSLLKPLVPLKPAMLASLQRPGMLASVGLLLLKTLAFPSVGGGLSCCHGC